MTYAATTARDPEAINAGVIDTFDGVITAGTVINRGDIVIWSSTIYTPATASSEGASVAGVAIGTSPRPVGGGATISQTTLEIRRRGVVSMKTESGTNYTNGMLVCPGTVDAQSVIEATSGNANYWFGFVWLPEGGTVAGAAGTYINVYLLPQWPKAGA